MLTSARRLPPIDFLTSTVKARETEPGTWMEDGSIFKVLMLMSSVGFLAADRGGYVLN